jgi:hypothetical protein
MNGGACRDRHSIRRITDAFGRMQWGAFVTGAAQNLASGDRCAIHSWSALVPFSFSIVYYEIRFC